MVLNASIVILDTDSNVNPNEKIYITSVFNYYFIAQIISAPKKN